MRRRGEGGECETTRRGKRVRRREEGRECEATRRGKRGCEATRRRKGREENGREEKGRDCSSRPRLLELQLIRLRVEYSLVPAAWLSVCPPQRSLFVDCAKHMLWIHGG